VCSSDLNLSALTDAVLRVLDESLTEETLTFGQNEYELVSLIHDAGEVLETKYEDDRIIVRVRMPRARFEQIHKTLDRRRSAGR
jgi:50S ribosomal subunit-associated GTPase HflX